MAGEHPIQTTPIISGPSIRFLARAYSSTFVSISEPADGQPAAQVAAERSPC